jgi:DNA-binding XRE family transcriptional regulator
MTKKTTTDAVEIIRHKLAKDPKLALLVEQERQQLGLAEKIQNMRKEGGLSQKELAERIGTTQSAISRLERGDYARLSVSTLLKISLALDYHVRLDFEPAV